MQEYDYLILGAGIGGLSTAALLTQAGKSVLVLEQYKVPGGYTHTLKKGKYSFCHEVQYLMGCDKDGPTKNFLRKLQLDKEVTFNSLDKKTFDLVSIKNKRVGIPHGVDNFEKELVKLYPEHANNLHKFYNILKTIYNEGHQKDKILSKKDILTAPLKYRHLLWYSQFTLHDIFEKFKFPIELQAILAGQAGNLAASPKEASLVLHAGMHLSYAKSAHFPKRGMGFFVQKIVDKIEEKNKIITNCEVKRILCSENKVTSVKTSKGTFSAKKVISNIDPQKTIHMLENAKLPKSYLKKVNYKYSYSAFSIYLGLKKVDLKKYGFGRKNIWHHSTFDIDEEFRSEVKHNDFSHPFLFISTPSLLAE